MQDREKMDVGGHSLSFQITGSGEPTIVFESGGECGAESLANLAHGVASFTRALVYDRAGLGGSDLAPHPRTVQDAVNDLHALLHTARIPGPYLLVGHSFGGLIARLYAYQHLPEVVGLVLLDVPHPEQALRELRCLPPPSFEEPVVLTAYRDTLQAEWEDPLHNAEGFDKVASALQMQAANSLEDLPLVIITAGINEWDEGFPEEIAATVGEDWRQVQAELLRLSSQSRQIVATESTHTIQECQPDLVIEILEHLVETYRVSQVCPR